MAGGIAVPSVKCGNKRRGKRHICVLQPNVSPTQLACCLPLLLIQLGDPLERENRKQKRSHDRERISRVTVGEKTDDGNIERSREDEQRHDRSRVREWRSRT